MLIKVYFNIETFYLNKHGGNTTHVNLNSLLRANSIEFRELLIIRFYDGLYVCAGTETSLSSINVAIGRLRYILGYIIIEWIGWWRERWIY